MTTTPSKRRSAAPEDVSGMDDSEPVGDGNQRSDIQTDSQSDSPICPEVADDDSHANARHRARVLLDCRYGRCNTLVELDAEAIAQGVAEHCLDADPVAIAFLLEPPCQPSC